MYGEDRGYTGSANLYKGLFFLVMWPIGWITLIAIAAIDVALSRMRPLLAEYPRHAAAIATGLLLPEIISLLLQPQQAIAVAIDVGLCLALVAWLVLRYSRMAGILLALNEAVGIVMAIKARMAPHTIGLFFVWAIVAVVVVRLVTIGLIGLSLRRGMRVAVDLDVFA